MNKEVRCATYCLVLFVLTFWLFFFVSSGVTMRFERLKEELNIKINNLPTYTLEFDEDHFISKEGKSIKSMTLYIKGMEYYK